MSEGLRLRLTRLSNDRHRFEAIRADGSREVLDLETRSYLAHDLMHLALESAIGTNQGFYGLLATGRDYTATAEMFAGETGRIERVVARMQGAVRESPDPAQLTSQIRAGFEAMDEASPAWLTPEAVARALELFRSLIGRWKAMPFGTALEVDFPYAFPAGPGVL